MTARDRTRTGIPVDANGRVDGEAYVRRYARQLPEEELAAWLAEHADDAEERHELADLAADLRRDDIEEAVAENLTDLGNAERLVERHGHDLRYCHPWARWLVWDGRRWRPDDVGEIVRRAKETLRVLQAEAVKIGDDGERRRLIAHSLASERDARIRAAITLAQSEHGVPVLPEQLDQDPWVLNVENGTVDLRTGQLRRHRRGDLLTKLVPVAYDPNADCPIWEAFLEQVLIDADLIRFLQRAVGYSLTGSTGEQVLFLLYGTGANGKSTVVETLRAMLGDYALQSPPETLLDRRDGIPNDIARLRGGRFVSAIETGEGRRLAESMVKTMTGGDTLVARFMRAEFFEFRPEFKLWLATNHKPTIRGTDEAIWRRIRLIPFTVTIPEPERERDFGQRLLAELPGILAWAVRGCAEWQAGELGYPDAVRQATADYRDEQDVLGAWIADRCVTRDDIRGLAKALYDDYRSWADQTGEKPLTQTSFGLRLGERGYEKHRGAKGAWWRVGISLAAGDELGAQVTSFPEPEAVSEPEQVTGDELVTSFPSFPRSARAEADIPKNPSQPVTRHPERAQPASVENNAEGQDGALPPSLDALRDAAAVASHALRQIYSPDHGDRYAQTVLWMIPVDDRPADLRYQFIDIPDTETERLCDLAADLEANHRANRLRKRNP